MWMLWSLLITLTTGGTSFWFRQVLFYIIYKELCDESSFLWSTSGFHVFLFEYVFMRYIPFLCEICDHLCFRILFCCGLSNLVIYWFTVTVKEVWFHFLFSHKAILLQASPSDQENFPFVVLGNKVDVDGGNSRVVSLFKSYFGFNPQIHTAKDHEIIIYPSMGPGAELSF